MMRMRYPELLRSRVHLIARTETAKASSALTEARCTDLGVNFYQWLTSEDARVRSSHAHMANVIVPWNEPPDPDQLAGIKSRLGPGHAGCFPNCRCTSAAILDIEDVHFPAKVYHGGAIKMMNEQQFRATFANASL